MVSALFDAGNKIPNQSTDEVTSVAFVGYIIMKWSSGSGSHGGIPPGNRARDNQPSDEQNRKPSMFCYDKTFCTLSLTKIR